LITICPKEEGAKIQFTPVIDLRLALPQLESKMHLVFLQSQPTPPTISMRQCRPPGAFRPVRAPSSYDCSTLFFWTNPQESFFVRTESRSANFRPSCSCSCITGHTFHIRTRASGSPERASDGRTPVGKRTRGSISRDCSRQALFSRATLDGVWAAQTKEDNYSLNFALPQKLAPTHALACEAH